MVQKLRPCNGRGGFCLLMELHWEGSAPAACAAGLFNRTVVKQYWEAGWYEKNKHSFLEQYLPRKYEAVALEVYCVEIFRILFETFLKVLKASYHFHFNVKSNTLFSARQMWASLITFTNKILVTSHTEYLVRNPGHSDHLSGLVLQF